MNELALFCGNKCTRESAPDVAPQELRKEEQMGGPVNCSDSELCTFLQALEAGFLPTYYSETSPSVQSKSMSIASKSYRRGKQTVLFHGFPSLQMSQNLTEDIGEELLTWFREGFLAKTLAQQEQTAATKERDLTEASQDCGASLPESLAKLNQNGSWLKTPITCEPKVLDEFSKIETLGSEAAGTQYRLHIQDGVVFKHDPAAIVIPGGINLTTVAGSIVTLESLGTGVWTITGYTALLNPAKINVNTATIGTIATPLVVAGASSNPAQINIAERTSNGTNVVSLIAPASIASNRSQTLQDADGIVAILYTGGVIQSIKSTVNARVNTPATVPFDDTPPQISEGALVASVTITPKFINSVMRISATCSGAAVVAGGCVIYITKDLNTSALAASSINASGGDHNVNMSVRVEDAVSALTPITYKLYAGGQNGITQFNVNGNSSGRLFGDIPKTFLLVEEIVG